MSYFIVHNGFHLFTTLDKFYVEPRNNSGELLVIDRQNSNMDIEKSRGQLLTSAKIIVIYGLVGIIELPAGKYLVVITKASFVGVLNGHEILRVEDTEMFAFTEMPAITQQQFKDNDTCISMMKNVLKTPSLYFSYSYDLTNSLQRSTSPDSAKIPPVQRCDERFIWNHYLLENLACRPELAKYAMPIIHGIIDIQNGDINNKKFTYTLISRRCRRFAGTRSYTRGGDENGNVANNVETEQIVEYEGNQTSFVQTRGSVPIFWSQYPSGWSKPEVTPGRDHLSCVSKHFDTQIQKYGKQYIINLLDQVGIEGRLTQVFLEALDSYASHHIKYHGFNFHQEATNMQLGVILNHVRAEQNEYGYFTQFADGTVARRQDGVFRTNCLSCSDRTNVIQGMLACRNMEQVLVDFGILCQGDQLKSTPFQAIFNQMWINNANALSDQYAATDALKTEYTSNGSQNIFGKMRDGLLSLKRQSQSIYSEGSRQDAIDLFLGNYIVKVGEALPLCPAYIIDWPRLVHRR